MRPDGEGSIYLRPNATSRDAVASGQGTCRSSRVGGTFDNRSAAVDGETERVQAAGETR